MAASFCSALGGVAAFSSRLELRSTRLEQPRPALAPAVAESASASATPAALFKDAGGYVGVIVARESVELAAKDDGRLIDIYVGLGERIERGGLVASIDKGALRGELAGYPYAYQQLQVSSVGNEVVGPNEVRRYLPPELADAIHITEPAVLVQASLPSSTFIVDGYPFHYYEGMQGMAEVRVKEERLLVTIVPALRMLFSHEP